MAHGKHAGEYRVRVDHRARVRPRAIDRPVHEALDGRDTFPLDGIAVEGHRHYVVERRRVRGHAARRDVHGLGAVGARADVPRRAHDQSFAIHGLPGLEHCGSRFRGAHSVSCTKPSQPASQVHPTRVVTIVRAPEGGVRLVEPRGGRQPRRGLVHGEVPGRRRSPDRRANGRDRGTGVRRHRRTEHIGQDGSGGGSGGEPARQSDRRVIRDRRRQALTVSPHGKGNVLQHRRGQQRARRQPFGEGYG